MGEVMGVREKLGTRRRRVFAQHGNGLLGSVLLGTAVLLAGCSSVPDAVNPAEWYKSTVDLFSKDADKNRDPDEEAQRAREKQVAAAAGPEKVKQEFPKLSQVEQQKESRNLGLAADPERPRYAPAIPRQDQVAATDALRNAPAAPPPPSPTATKEMAGKEMAAKTSSSAAPKLTPPKAMAGSEKPVPSTVPGVPQIEVPTQAEQETEFKVLQNRMQKRLAEILAAAGEQPRFVGPVGVSAGGGDETVVISGEGVSGGGAGEASSFNGLLPQGANQAALPLPAGATRIATIVFPNGSAKLSSRDRQILSQVVELLKERGGTIRVVGHSSSRTRNLTAEKHQLVNYKMSEERAQIVARELIRRGAGKGNVLTAALSDSQPLYQEIMPNGEAGNRRAEIYLTN